MREVLRNFTEDEIWALEKAISGEVDRLTHISRERTEEESRLGTLLHGLLPEIHHAWEILQERKKESIELPLQMTMVRVKNPLPFQEAVGLIDNIRFEVGKPILYHRNLFQETPSIYGGDE